MNALAIAGSPGKDHHAPLAGAHASISLRVTRCREAILEGPPEMARKAGMRAVWVME